MGSMAWEWELSCIFRASIEAETGKTGPFARTLCKGGSTCMHLGNDLLRNILRVYILLADGLPPLRNRNFVPLEQLHLSLTRRAG